MRVVVRKIELVERSAETLSVYIRVPALEGVSPMVSLFNRFTNNADFLKFRSMEGTHRCAIRVSKLPGLRNYLAINGRSFWAIEVVNAHFSVSYSLVGDESGDIQKLGVQFSWR
jgi:hypothetical protein